MPDATPVARIRAATAGLHRRLEELPYSRAVMDGSLPVSRYGAFLRGLLPIVEDAERGFPSLVDLPKVPLLARDLAELQIDRYGVDMAVLTGMLLGQRLRLAAPGFAAGVLYVVEGSTLGGLVQRKALAGRLPAGAQAWLSAYGAATRAHFEAFVKRLDAALEGAAVEAACEGAMAAFETIGAIAAEVMLGERAATGAALNPGAGTHPVAGDVREIRAALEAGEISWQRFGYYEARYGERGRRFTRSDSAWLAGLSPEVAAAQLDWLSRVLAARGMPRFLLEDHLLTLHPRLCEARPDRAAHHRGLLDAAHDLRARRRAAVPDAVFDACDAALPELRAGALLAAAAADERNGVPAMDSLRPWLVERLGAKAVARVLALLEER